jgi:hypothetical protein
MLSEDGPNAKPTRPDARLLQPREGDASGRLQRGRSECAVDDQFVYWTAQDNPGAVLKAPIGGGAAPVILAGSFDPVKGGLGDPSGLAVGNGSDAFVYWTNKVDGTVMKMARSGGTPILLASGQKNPSAIAVGQGTVYWATTGDGSIWKVVK